MFFSRRWAVELSHMDGLEDDIPSQIKTPPLNAVVLGAQLAISNQLHHRGADGAQRSRSKDY